MLQILGFFFLLVSEQCLVLTSAHSVAVPAWNRETRRGLFAGKQHTRLLLPAMRARHLADYVRYQCGDIPAQIGEFLTQRVDPVLAGDMLGHMDYFVNCRIQKFRPGTCLAHSEYRSTEPGVAESEPRIKVSGVYVL